MLAGAIGEGRGLGLLVHYSACSADVSRRALERGRLAGRVLGAIVSRRGPGTPLGSDFPSRREVPVERWVASSSP
eukprot:7852850-Alexandrium_andersonii.AAC.1